MNFLSHFSLFFVRSLSTLTVVIFSFSVASATTTSSAQTKPFHKLQKKLSPQKPSPIFSGSFNLAQYGSLVDHEDGSRSQTLDGSLSLNYKISENYKADSLFYYSHNNKTQEGDWDDLNIGLYRKANPFFSRLLLSPGFLGMVPMSKDSRLRKEYLGGIGGVARFSFTPETFIPGFDFKFSISVTKNFYKYENATDGKPNSSYTSIQKIKPSYSMGKWTIAAAFFHINTISFQDQLRESFIHFEEVAYDFNPQFGISIGHANTGSALKPNGQDNNILLINENSSVVYASTTVNF